MNSRRVCLIASAAVFTARLRLAVTCRSGSCGVFRHCKEELCSHSNWAISVPARRGRSHILDGVWGHDRGSKVTGPEGAPFRACHCRLENSKTRVTVIVLSGNDGTYRVENLPASNYRVQARSVDYRSGKSGIFLAANQNATFDWTLQKQMVHWDEIPIIQGINLFPEGPGKEKFSRCGSSCHGFEQFINVRRDGAALARRPQGHDVYKNRRRHCCTARSRATRTSTNLRLTPPRFSGTGPEAPSRISGRSSRLCGLDEAVHDDALKIVCVMYEMRRDA